MDVDVHEMRSERGFEDSDHHASREMVREDFPKWSASPPSFLVDHKSCGGVSTQLWLTFLALGGGMTRGDKSVGVQTFLILENIAQKFLLKSPLESTHREELKSAL